MSRFRLIVTAIAAALALLRTRSARRWRPARAPTRIILDGRRGTEHLNNIGDESRPTDPVELSGCSRRLAETVTVKKPRKTPQAEA